MVPWNEGADRSLGRSPTYRTLARGIPQRSNSRRSVQRTPQCEHLRYVRPALNLRYGAISRLIYLGETNGLESSEDCRSTGGHGNQHVRLRSAQIDRIAAICPAPQAVRLLRAVAGVRRPGCQDGRVYSDRLPSSRASALTQALINVVSARRPGPVYLLSRIQTSLASNN
jgi:hypothetical protein